MQACEACPDCIRKILENAKLAAVGPNLPF
jgi:hypothetical protein